MADLIGFNTRKVIEDVRRLSKFASSLNKKLELLNGEQLLSMKKRRPHELNHPSLNSKISKQADLIKILASRKFGPPGGESVQASRPVCKQAVIVPRQTKLTLDRAAFSRSKSSTTAEASPPPPQPGGFDFVSDCFSVSAAQELNAQPAAEPVEDAPTSKRQFLSDPSCTMLKQESPKRPNTVEHEEPQFLDLSEDELESILRNKTDLVHQEKFRSTRFLSDVKLNDVLANISKDIVDNLVTKVCQEVFDSNFIDLFIQLELKPADL